MYGTDILVFIDKVTDSAFYSHRIWSLHQLIVSPKSYTTGSAVLFSPSACRITDRRRALSTGFCRKAIAPALSAKSLLGMRTRPETAITGIIDRLAFAFNLSRTLKP